MSAALAISLPPRAHPTAANDNFAISVRAKINLVPPARPKSTSSPLSRLTAQRRFDSQDQIPRRVYDHMGKLAYSHKHTDGEGVTPIRLQSGQMIAKWTGTKLTYMHTNHLGTPIRGTHGSGAGHAVGETVFDEFTTPFGLNPTSGWHGNTTSGYTPPFGPGSNAGVTGFTDHVKDVETGLTYMQARHYDPVAGRFLSIDPVTFLNTGEPSQFNRYMYGNNDPINMFDPNGRDSIVALKGNDTTGVLRKPIIAHAYVEITDTETGAQVILRAGPAGGASKGSLASSGASSSSEPNSYSNSSTSGKSQGSSSGGPGGTIKAQVDPIADSPDTAYQNSRPNVQVETLATATVPGNFSDTVAAAESFAQSVNDAGVNYDAFYTNSNSTAGTGFEQLTGQSRPSDANYPALGTDLCNGRVEC